MKNLNAVMFSLMFVIHFFGVTNYFFADGLEFSQIAPFLIFGIVISILSLTTVVVLLRGKPLGAVIGIATLLISVLFYSWDFAVSIPSAGENRLITFISNIVFPTIMLIPAVLLWKKQRDNIPNSDPK